MDVPSVMAVCSQSLWRPRLLLSAGDTPKLTLRLQPKEDALERAAKLVEDLTLKHKELSAADAAQ